MAKIVLDNIRSKTTIKLPTSGGTIQMWDYPLVGELPTNVNQHNVKTHDGLSMIAKMIVSWDFVDVDGNELPVTTENIEKLPVPDFIIIAKAVEEKTKSTVLSSEEKKISQSNSISG